jgi:hypothetical protein
VSVRCRERTDLELSGGYAVVSNVYADGCSNPVQFR